MGREGVLLLKQRRGDVSMTKKRILIQLLSVFAVALLAVGGMVSGALAAEKVKFFLDWVPYGKHSSFFAGVKYGIYKKYGLDVTIQPGKGSGLSIKTIGAKRADYGHADMGTLIVNRGNNPDLKVKQIAMLHHNNLFNITVLEKSGIKHPKELEGKRIGSSVGNSTRIVFPALAAATGLNPCKVIWVDMQAASQNASLLAGKVDAIPSYNTVNPTLIKMAKKVGKRLRFLKYSDYGVDIYSNGLIGHEDTLRDKPNRTRRFVVASLEAFQWSVANPSKAVGSFIEKYPHVTRDLARGHWEIGVDVAITKNTKRTGFGFMVREKVQRTIDTMFKIKKPKSEPSADEIYTNEFVGVFLMRAM